MKKFYVDDLISCTCLSVTIVVVIANVLMRYFFNSPIRSAEEVATICFIWSVFVGGASCYRKKMHMGIDILVQVLPDKYKNYVSFLINIIVIIMTGAFFALSLKFAIISRLKPTAVLGISSIYVNFSLVIGFGLMFIYAVIAIINDIKTILKVKGDKNV
ncbi:TRAP transporter small permease [Fusobacterium sp.]|uniref:TRAP transporter small permease n=1 Tax=Fusobacterium sp. TaxID=68766 RepID=UPI00262E3C0C|nr:TRAP transporter small permease [Fusobacterium sp.]